MTHPFELTFTHDPGTNFNSVTVEFLVPPWALPTFVDMETFADACADTLRRIARKEYP